MPPAPICERISYGPSLALGLSIASPRRGCGLRCGRRFWCSRGFRRRGWLGLGNYYERGYRFETAFADAADGKQVLGATEGAALPAEVEDGLRGDRTDAGKLLQLLEAGRVDVDGLFRRLFLGGGGEHQHRQPHQDHSPRAKTAHGESCSSRDGCVAPGFSPASWPCGRTRERAALPAEPGQVPGGATQGRRRERAAL